MYTICRQVKFSAGHWLLGLPSNHPCTDSHGHNYTVEVELQSETLDLAGMVIDLSVIKEVVMVFDHKVLNDILPPTLSPTAENIAMFIKKSLEMRFDGRWKLPETAYSGPERSIWVKRVRVWETDTSWAEVS